MNRNEAERAAQALTRWLTEKQPTIHGLLMQHQNALVAKLVTEPLMPATPRRPFAPTVGRVYPHLVAGGEGELPLFIPAIYKGDHNAIEPVSTRDLACRGGIAAPWWFAALFLLPDQARVRALFPRTLAWATATAKSSDAPDDVLAHLWRQAWAYIHPDCDPTDLGALAPADVEGGEDTLQQARAWNTWWDAGTREDTDETVDALSAAVTRILAMRRWLYGPPASVGLGPIDAPYLAPLRAAMRTLRVHLLTAYGCVYEEIQHELPEQALPSPARVAALLVEPSAPVDRVGDEPRQPGLWALPLEPVEAPIEAPIEAPRRVPAATGVGVDATAYTLVVEERERPHDRETRERIAAIISVNKATHQLRRNGFLHVIEKERTRLGTASVYKGAVPVRSTAGGHVGLLWEFKDGVDDVIEFAVLYDPDTYIVQQRRVLNAAGYRGSAGAPDVREDVYGEDIADSDRPFSDDWLQQQLPTWNLTLGDVNREVGYKADFFRFLLAMGLDRFLASDHSFLQTADWGGGARVFVTKTPGKLQTLSLGYVYVSDNTVDLLMTCSFHEGQIAHMTYRVLGGQLGYVTADASAVKFNIKAFKQQDTAKLLKTTLDDLLGPAPERAPEPKVRKAPRKVADVPPVVVPTDTVPHIPAKRMSVEPALRAQVAGSVLREMVTDNAGVITRLTFSVMGESFTGVHVRGVAGDTRGTWTWSGGGYTNHSASLGEFLRTLWSPAYHQVWDGAAKMADPADANELRTLLLYGTAIYRRDSWRAALSAVPILATFTRATMHDTGEVEVQVVTPGDPNVKAFALDAIPDDRTRALLGGELPGAWRIGVTGGDITIIESTRGSPRRVTVDTAVAPWLTPAGVFGAPRAGFPADPKTLIRPSVVRFLVPYIQQQTGTTPVALLFVSPVATASGTALRGAWFSSAAPPSTSPGDSTSDSPRNPRASSVFGSGWEWSADGLATNPQVPGLGLRDAGDGNASVVHVLSNSAIVKLSQNMVANAARVLVEAAVLYGVPSVFTDPVLGTPALLYTGLGDAFAHAIQAAMDDVDQPFASTLRRYMAMVPLRNYVPVERPAPVEAPRARWSSDVPATGWRTYEINEALRTSLLATYVTTTSGLAVGGETVRIRTGIDFPYQLSGPAWVIDACIQRLAPNDAKPLDALTAIEGVRPRTKYMEYAAWEMPNHDLAVVVRAISVVFNPAPYVVIRRGHLVTVQGKTFWQSFEELYAAVAAILGAPEEATDDPAPTGIYTGLAQPTVDPLAGTARTLRAMLPEDVPLPAGAEDGVTRLTSSMDAPVGSVYAKDNALFIVLARFNDDEQIERMVRPILSGRLSSATVRDPHFDVRLLVRGAPQDTRDVEIEDFVPVNAEIARRIALAQASLAFTAALLPAFPTYAPKTPSVHEQAMAYLLTAKHGSLYALATGAPWSLLADLREALGAYLRAIIPLTLDASSATDMRADIAVVAGWWEGADASPPPSPSAPSSPSSPPRGGPASPSPVSPSPVSPSPVSPSPEQPPEGAGAPLSATQTQAGMRVVIGNDHPREGLRGRHGVVTMAAGMAGGDTMVMTDAGTTVNVLADETLLYREAGVAPVVVPDPMAGQSTARQYRTLPLELWQALQKNAIAEQDANRNAQRSTGGSARRYREAAGAARTAAADRAGALADWIRQYPAAARAVWWHNGETPQTLADPPVQVILARYAPAAADGAKRAVEGGADTPVDAGCRNVVFQHEGHRVEVTCDAQGRRDAWQNITHQGTRYGWNGSRWARGQSPSAALLAAVRAEGITVFPS